MLSVVRVCEDVWKVGETWDVGDEVVGEGKGGSSWRVVKKLSASRKREKRAQQLRP